MGRLRDLIRGNVILARKQARYKQSDVAAALKLTTKTVSDWERGRATPSYDHLDELAKFYGLEDGSEWFGVIRPEAMALIVDADKMREDMILKMAAEINEKRTQGSGRLSFHKPSETAGQVNAARQARKHMKKPA
jgi:transcriptional regulator with XRE-family HTH domain